MNGALTDSAVRQAVTLGEGELEGSDLDFYRRVWSTPLDDYRARLRALHFTGMESVLDAGAGFGQWTMCLSELNRQVYAVDSSPTRVKAVQAIVQELDIANVAVSHQSIEALSFPDGVFDGIFCYSVLYMTDHRKTLHQFARVLKPGGLLYICSNGLGWYVYNLVRGPNSSPHFKPRRLAASTMAHSLAFAVSGNKNPAKHLILSGMQLRNYLELNGFEVNALGGEGTVNVSRERDIRRFYVSRYYGLEGIYEVLARRKRHFQSGIA